VKERLGLVLLGLVLLVQALVRSNLSMYWKVLNQYSLVDHSKLYNLRSQKSMRMCHLLELHFCNNFELVQVQGQGQVLGLVLGLVLEQLLQEWVLQE
jgi:hypothetical protein